MTTRTRATGLLLAITTTAALAACSGASDSSDDAGTDGGGSSSSALAPEEAGLAEGGGDAADTAAGATASQSGDQSRSQSGGKAAPATTGVMRRSLISTGTVSLSGDDVAATRREVQRVVDAQGGEITDESSESDEDGEAAYARMVVRVPSAAFGATMEALEGVGTLRASDRGSKDVTTEVIDTDVRVRAQRKSLQRVEALLAEAEQLKDVIWIESQLTQRQAELDSLVQQQAWLADQTSLATITVDVVRTPEEETEDPAEPAGFLAGLDGGMTALGASVVVVLTLLGAVLPFAVLGLLLGVPAWLVLRRRRQAPPAAPAAEG